MAAILGNLVVTPLYSGMSVDDVAALIVPVLLPFNGLKVLINAIVASAATPAVRSMAEGWD